MMPLMQKMAAPLALASALCHIATIAVMMNMHIELSTVRDTPADPHRALLDSDGDALVTVAHMTKAVDHLQDTLGSRLTAVERENSVLRGLVMALAGKTTDTDHGTRVDSDGGALDMTKPCCDQKQKEFRTSWRWLGHPQLASKKSTVKNGDGRAGRGRGGFATPVIFYE